MPGSSIVIIGGGVGGRVAANELRRRLPREHRITVVERNPVHAFAPSFLWLMVGTRTRAEITRPVTELIDAGVDVRIGTVSSIDRQARHVLVGSEVLSYDYLILAPGAELAFDATPGASEAHTFFTLEGSERLFGELRSFKGAKVAVVVAGTPYKCPGAPAEGAMLIAGFLRRRGLNPTVSLFTPEPQPMPVAGPDLGAAVQKMLRDRSIAYEPQHRLRAIEERTLLFEGRDPIRADLIAVIPAHRPPSFLRATGLTNEAGWTPADPATLATADDRIFAIGDCTAVPLPGRWDPSVPLALPKAGVFAHAQALVVARRLAAKLAHRETSETFCGDGFCMLEAGGDLAGFAFGDFFATPTPDIHLRTIGRRWHVGKVLFEKWWLSRPGPMRSALELTLRGGARVAGMPLDL